MKKKKSTSKDDDDIDEGGNGGNITPLYYDTSVPTIDEAEITALADKALHENRISIKSKGIIVTALDKPQEDRNRLQNDNNNPGLSEDGGSGLGLEDHPELAEMGGMVDPNIIVLPKSEQDALAVKDMDLKLRLLAEYKKKMDMKMGAGMKPTEKPSPAPTIRPTNTPHPRPRPF